MTPELFNTILLISFFALIFIALLGGLIGLMKGIYKTTLKTIVKAVLVLILVFITPFLSTLIGEINIQFILQSEQSVTLHSFIVEKLSETGFFSPVNAISIYSTIFAIATSIIAYATFLIGALLIQLLASPLTALLYHGIFRWILPIETKAERKARKKDKKAYKLKGGLPEELTTGEDKVGRKWKLHRFLGFLLGTVQELLMVIIIITPVIGLSSIVIDNKKQIRDTMNTINFKDENVDKVNEYVDIVDQSLLYQSLSGLGLSRLIMDQASKVNVNGTELSFSGLFKSTLDIATPILDKGAITFDVAAKNVTINVALLMSTSMVNTVVDSLINNPMILALIPPLIDVALNSVSGNSFVIDNLNFDNIDWKNDLTAIKSFYSAIYSSAIEPMLQDNFDFTNFNIKTSEMSDTEITTIVNATKNLGKMEFISKNLPIILSNVGTYLHSLGLELLPTDKDDYAQINWETELGNYINVVLRLMRTLGLDISSSLSTLDFNTVLNEAFGDETKREEIETYFLSNADKSVVGLIDTQLFSHISIPNILSSTLTNIPGITPYLKEINIDKIFEGYKVDDYRSEIRTIFDIFGQIFSPDSKIDLANLSSINLQDEEVASQLALLLDTSNNSKLFSSVYPSLMKGLVFNNTFDFSDFLYGLTPYNFNYEADDFISDLSTILRLLPRITTLQNLMSNDSLSAGEKIKQLDVSLIRELLTIITQSDFFNSDMLTGVSSTRQKNVNLHTFLTNFFENDLFKSFNFKVPSVDELQTIVWEDTHQGTIRGEISILCSLLTDVQANASFFSSTSHDLGNLENTDAIASLIRNGMESKLLSPSIVEIIDASLGEYLDKIGIHISLDEMRNSMWVDDSIKIGELLDLMIGLDFDDLDFNTLNIDKLNGILTILHDTHFIQVSNHYDDHFGYALYSLIKSFDFFDGLGITPTLSTFDLSKDSTKDWVIQRGQTTITSDEKELTFEITTEGEIYTLCEFFKKIQKYGLDAINGGNLPVGLMDDLKSVTDSHVIRSLLSSILTQTVNSIPLPEDFANVVRSIDFSLFLTMSKEQADKELELFDMLYQMCHGDYNDSGMTKMNYITDHIYSLEDSLLTDFYHLIDLMAESALMNTVKQGYELSPLGLFFKGVIYMADLDSKISLVEGVNKEKAVTGILKEVADWEIEVANLKDIIQAIQGLNASLDLGSTLNYTKAKSLLNLLNSSTVFHRVPIYVLKTSIQDNGFDSFLEDPVTHTIVHPLRFDVHLGVSQDDINYWKNDIDALVEMMLGDNGLNFIFENDGTSLDDIDINSTSFKLDFLYYLGITNLFKDTRSYILYNLMSKNATDNFDISKLFKASSKAPYGENANVYRFEELFFSNEKLLDEQTHILDEDKAKQDLGMLLSVFSLMLDKASQLSNVTSASQVDVDFEKINNCAIDLTNGFYRSDLTSELIAGVETAMLTNNYFKLLFVNASSMDLYADEHFLVNPVEGRGLNGLVKLAKELESVAPIAYSSLQEIFDCFGLTASQLASKTLDDISKINYFLTLDEYNNCNSKLIISEHDKVMYIVVTPAGSVIPSTIANVIPEMTLAALENDSYSHILEIYHDRIA